MTRYGFVLSSDGSKSSFEIGAWKAMHELKLDITSVSGSFVGALNAALIAQNDFEKAVRFWRNVSSKRLLGVNRHIAQKYTEEWSRTDTKAFKKNFMSFIQGKSEELDPLREVIHNYIDERAVRRSGVDCGFVTISLQSLEAEMINVKKIPSGRLDQYLLSAACFPQITQTNRAADPQFSTQYSPYSIVDRNKTDIILSTDEVIVVPPSIKSEVRIIRSSEAMELSINESAEDMRHNIKMGYIDTLRLYQHSLGNTYFIPDSSPQAIFGEFKNKIGRSINPQLDALARMILRLNNLTPENANKRFEQMMKVSGVHTEDIYLALLENAAQIMGLPNNERYNPDKLITALSAAISQKIKENKRRFTDVSFIRHLVMSAAEPGNSYPNADLFTQYFLLFLSSKPSAYKKLAPLLGALNIKTLAAFVTFIYILY